MKANKKEDMYYIDYIVDGSELDKFGKKERKLRKKLKKVNSLINELTSSNKDNISISILYQK